MMDLEMHRDKDAQYIIDLSKNLECMKPRMTDLENLLGLTAQNLKSAQENETLLLATNELLERQISDLKNSVRKHSEANGVESQKRKVDAEFIVELEGLLNEARKEKISDEARLGQSIALVNQVELDAAKGKKELAHLREINT
jgi:hypothetical protein